MRIALKCLILTLLSIVLHLALGWAWTVGAGLAAGLWQPARGWLLGTAVVASGWAALVAYSFAVFPYGTSEMTRVFGMLMGNLPAAATVAATILIGALLGGLSGLLGSLLSRLITHREVNHV